MKLTQKSIKTEVETAETVCEISKDEFYTICAQTATETIIKEVWDDHDIDAVICGVIMTELLAKFASRLGKKLFNDNTENPDKNEKEEK